MPLWMIYRILNSSAYFLLCNWKIVKSLKFNSESYRPQWVDFLLRLCAVCILQDGGKESASTVWDGGGGILMPGLIVFISGGYSMCSSWKSKTVVYLVYVIMKNKRWVCYLLDHCPAHIFTTKLIHHFSEQFFLKSTEALCELSILLTKHKHCFSLKSRISSTVVTAM